MVADTYIAAAAAAAMNTAVAEVGTDHVIEAGTGVHRSERGAASTDLLDVP